MPSPARRMGVNPTLCLTTEPVKGLIGDCCGSVRGRAQPACKIDDSSAYPMDVYLLESTAGLVSEHDAEFMDPLWRCTQGHCYQTDAMDFTSRNSLDVVDTWRNFAKRVFTRG